jgi:hypothetical protein
VTAVNAEAKKKRAWEGADDRSDGSRGGVYRGL